LAMSTGSTDAPWPPAAFEGMCDSSFITSVLK
jgi:hypothetical protein